MLTEQKSQTLITSYYELYEAAEHLQSALYNFWRPYKNQLSQYKQEWLEGYFGAEFIGIEDDRLQFKGDYGDGEYFYKQETSIPVAYLYTDWRSIEQVKIQKALDDQTAIRRSENMRYKKTAEEKIAFYTKQLEKLQGEV